MKIFLISNFAKRSSKPRFFNREKNVISFFYKKLERIITFSERRKLHVVVAEVAFAAAVAHANVRVLVAQSLVRRSLHFAGVSLLASFCDSHLPVFLSEFRHAQLK